MALIKPKDILNLTPRFVMVDLDNLDEVDALFSAAIKRASPEQLLVYIRQRRSAEDIAADNEAERKDQQEEERGDYR